MIETNSRNDDRVLTKQQLFADLKVVLADAEALIQATTTQGGEALSAAREKAAESLKRIKEKLADAQTVLSARSKIATEATTEYVRTHPLEAMGGAALVGVLIGLLLARR